MFSLRLELNLLDELRIQRLKGASLGNDGGSKVP
jgi:hypothetical protein